MRHSTLFWLLSLALLLTACDAARQAPQPQPESPFEFTILHFNDVYEIAPLEGGKVGGLARVATVKKELMKENPNTISVLSGDFLSPSLTGTLRKENGEKIAGQQMVEVLNAAGLDYATFGNHEFDLSDPDLLQERINQSTFEYTVCNVQRADSGMVRPFRQLVDGQDRPVPEYIVREFRNDKGQSLRLGIIGVCLPFNKAGYVHYEPVTEDFQATYEALKPQVDMVVALTHLNWYEDVDLAAAVPGIPLFMGGHDHVNMSFYNEETIITKADANVKSVYIHHVSYDPSSGFARIRSSLKKIDDSIPDDPATKAVVDKWEGKVNGLMESMGFQPDEQVMYTKEPLECKEVDIRNRQTNYGQLTVDAFAAAWPGADVYFINSGSMRMDDDVQGVVTQFDVLRTFPFGGSIVYMELPGNILEKVLSIGLNINKGEGGYFQIKNASQKNEQWLVNGQAIKPEAKYGVVLPKFVAEGGENNLGFLEDYPYKSKKELEINGQAVQNDVRNMVIAYMKTL